MKRNQLTLLAALVLVLAAATTSQAQFGPFGGYGTGEWSGDVDAIFVKVYGRGAKPKELMWARSVGYDNTQALLDEQKPAFTQLLKKHLRMPDGQEDLKDVITRSYKHAFGREPKAAEMNKWMTEITLNQTNFGYTELMDAHRQYLKTENSFMDRSYAIMHAYLDAWGRAPKPGEMDYWKGRMANDGSTYREVMTAAMMFILGSSQEQAIEFRETIKRAFAIAKLPEPDSDKIAKIRVKVQNIQHTFNQFVEIAKKS